MPRKRVTIPPKMEKDSMKAQDEKIGEVLTSLDTIQAKHHQTSYISDNPTNISFTKIIGVSTFVVIIVFGLIILGNPPQQIDNSNNPVEGNISDTLNFKIQLLDGSEVNLSDYAGNPIILDLFATWCQPCIQQISYFPEVRKDFPNVKIISVTVDLNDDIPTLTQFKAKYSMDWVVGRDFTQEGGRNFYANYIPTIAFINSNGIVKHWEQKVTLYSTLKAWINEN
ncbi:MAG: TlpA family protein disulfide reductase [Candidatus Hodarchaeota archaeon]